MKKGFKSALLASLFTCVLVLSGCVNDKAAEKINSAAESKEYYTVEKLEKSYGDPSCDLTVTALGSQNGVLIWVDGCKTYDEIQEKLDAGKKVEGLIVVILNNNAISAEYKLLSSEDIKK